MRGVGGGGGGEGARVVGFELGRKGENRIPKTRDCALKKSVWFLEILMTWLYRNRMQSRSLPVVYDAVSR